MTEDDAATVRDIVACREVFDTFVQKHGGRIVDSPGDNLLVEFTSVVDALHGAAEIQQALKLRNSELPENRKMEFRIGINLGDVIQEEDRIYGDGVNVAARLEGLAEPGGICISEAVVTAAGTNIPYSCEDIGEHSVKNIDRPIRAYRISMNQEPTTFEKYKNSIAEKFRPVNLLKQRLYIDTQYFPIKLISEEDNKVEPIDAIELLLNKDNQRVCLLGPSGSGKTAVVRRLIWQCLNIETIPFIIKIRDYTEPIVEYDIDTIPERWFKASIDKYCSDKEICEELYNFIDERKGIFIIDGFDELRVPVNNRKKLHQLELLILKPSSFGPNFPRNAPQELTPRITAFITVKIIVKFQQIEVLFLGIKILFKSRSDDFYFEILFPGTNFQFQW